MLNKNGPGNESLTIALTDLNVYWQYLTDIPIENTRVYAAYKSQYAYLKILG